LSGWLKEYLKSGLTLRTVSPLLSFFECLFIILSLVAGEEGRAVGRHWLATGTEFEDELYDWFLKVRKGTRVKL
jgi:hypothetical protein